MRILIIYKERAIRHALREILGEEGYEVLVVDKIGPGFEIAIKQKPDVILSELETDRLEGIELLDWIKGVRREAPVIVFISKKRVNEEEYKKNGAFGVLYAPLNLNELLSTFSSIKKILKSKKRVVSHSKDYPNPIIRVDCVILSKNENNELFVLLVENKYGPFKGCWGLLGDYLEGDETVEECASREVKEMTGIYVLPESEQLSQIGCFSAVDRDPRCRVITIAFSCILEKTEMKERADDRESRWFHISELPMLAFDHEHIIHQTIMRL